MKANIKVVLIRDENIDHIDTLKLHFLKEV